MREILRIITALVFIASGFVKAVDVRGFSFKLEEYFSPSVFNIPALEAASLPIAVFVVVLELLLGLMLLLKIRLKTVLLALIALCLFFTFLTFYSAYFNKVTDCGCFGDAIKFTPWQSFIKDIILLAALIILYIWYQKSFISDRLPIKRAGILVFGVLAVICAGVIIWGLIKEPSIDFRDYKTGTDLNAERLKIAQNPSEYKTFYLLRNKSTNEEKKVNQDDYVNDKSLWEEGTPWEIQSDKTTSELVKQGYKSEIIKFRLEDENGNDISDQILQLPEVYLLFSYEPAKIPPAKMLAFENKLKGKAKVFGISTAKSTFKTLPNLTMDKTAMKTIARSNPFILILKKGKIVQKIPAKDYNG